MTPPPADAAGAAPRAALLGRHPVRAAQLDALLATCWTSPALPPRLLALACARAATLQGAHVPPQARAVLDDATVAALPRWPADPALGDVERAVLAIAEQVTADAHGVDDAQRRAVTAHLGAAGLAVLLQGLTLHDGLARLDRVFGTGPDADPPAPTPQPPAPPLPDAFARSRLAAAPDVLAAFLRLYGAVWRDGVVDPAVLEVMRIRTARITDCGF